jgi:hypothetical protein
VQGLRLDAFAKLATAQTAAGKGDHETALAHYNKVIGKARSLWVKHWAMWHKLTLLDQKGSPFDAVDTYLTLVKQKAEPFYLASPPLSAIRRTDAKQLKIVAQRLDKMRSSSRKRISAQYKMMQDLIKIRQAEMGGDQSVKGSAEPEIAAATPPVKLMTTQDNGKSAVVLPSFVEKSDPITAMLRGGRFREAQEASQKRLQLKEPRMAMRLYQLGIAQLNLALADHDNQDQMLSAGLSLMRSIIYFPKSRYKGPAMIEAGLVHQKIGQLKIATELWRKARIEIDSETEPQLIARLDQLQGVNQEEQSLSN